MNKKTIYYISLTLILLLFLSVISYHLYGYYYACHPGFDFLIHQESINALSTFKSLNPFVYSQNINIFNDHFDPVIILGIPFIKIFNSHPIGHFLFQSFWYLGMLVFITLKLKDRPKEMLLSLFVAVLTGGLMSGLTFPLHPMTWSMLPLVALCYYIREKNKIAIVLLSCFLCFFKETFPYGPLTLGVWFLFRRDFKISLPIIIFSSGYLLFLNVFRESVVGIPFPYKEVYLNPLFKDPIARVLFLFKTLDYKSWFYLIYPFLIPLVLLIKYEVWGKSWWKKDKIVPALVFLIPFVGIHFLSNIMLKWNRVTFSAIFLGLFIFSSIPKKILKNKKLLVVIMVLTILGSSRYYTRIVKLLLFDKSKTCKINESTNNSLLKAREIISMIDKGKVVVSTSGLIPWSNREGKVILPAGGNSEMPELIDYLIMSRNDSGYILPWTKERVEKTIEICPGINASFVDQNIAILAGPFKESCMEYISTSWNTRIFEY